MSKYSARTGTYRKLCAAVKREEPVCALCGCPIDPRIKYPDPWSFSVDHILSQKSHPHLREVRSNCRASHLVCNQRRKISQPDNKPPEIWIERF